MLGLKVGSVVVCKSLPAVDAQVRHSVSKFLRPLHICVNSFTTKLCPTLKRAAPDERNSHGFLRIFEQFQTCWGPGESERRVSESARGLIRAGVWTRRKRLSSFGPSLWIVCTWYHLYRAGQCTASRVPRARRGRWNSGSRFTLLVSSYAG